jgi:hypothetical protein
MERLLASRDEPALQDLVPAAEQCRSDWAELSLPGERLHPCVDLRIHLGLV